MGEAGRWEGWDLGEGEGVERCGLGEGERGEGCGLGEGEGAERCGLGEGGLGEGCGLGEGENCESSEEVPVTVKLRTGPFSSEMTDMDCLMASIHSTISASVSVDRLYVRLDVCEGQVTKKHLCIIIL